MGNATAPTRRRRSAGEGSVYLNGNRWRGAMTWTNPDGRSSRRKSPPLSVQANTYRNDCFRSMKPHGA